MALQLQVMLYVPGSGGDESTDENDGENLCDDDSNVIDDDSRNSCCTCRCVLRALLFSILYLAQFAVVPLLILQTFDTYAILCFDPDFFCPVTHEYRIPLYQTIFSYSFYAVLGVSYLATALAQWSTLD